MADTPRTSTPHLSRTTLSLLVLVLLACATTAPGDALGHRGQGNAVPSNAGGDPKQTHPNWSDDYCTLSPDRIWGVHDFRHACVHHDGCYSGFPDAQNRSVYWVSKNQCDRWFFEDMRASCRDTHPGRSGWGHDRCMDAAYTYYGAVLEHGRGYKGPGGEVGRPTPQTHEPVVPLPQPTFEEQQPLTPVPTPARTIEVFNRLTNGSVGYREDSTPARLTTRPWKNCGSRGCNVDGTERATGGTYQPTVCWTTGDVTTNGENGSNRDDQFQYTSDRYYGVTHQDATRFISWVWIHPNHRGGLGLPHC